MMRRHGKDYGEFAHSYWVMKDGHSRDGMSVVWLMLVLSVVISGPLIVLLLQIINWHRLDWQILFLAVVVMAIVYLQLRYVESVVVKSVESFTDLRLETAYMRYERLGCTVAEGEEQDRIRTFYDKHRIDAVVQPYRQKYSAARPVDPNHNRP